METEFYPDYLTECGRIYFFLSQTDTTFFVINCLLCNKDYSEWLSYSNHICKKHLIKIHESNLQHTKDGAEIQLENTADDFTISKPIQTNSSVEMDDIKNESSNVLVEIEQREDFLEKHFDKYENSTVEVLDDNKTYYKPFFRLYKTDSEIMLKFIELLRQHPSQWDHKHYNFSHRDKRFDSNLNLTQQLNESFKLNLVPQSTRASVLCLLRWFEREYIRLLNCRQRNLEFTCPQLEYFEKLLEFLPHKHLKPTKCEVCFKHFKSEHLLMAHKHKYHNGQIPFRCQYCGHGFIHQSSHKIHENRHIKIHVWPCKQCLYQAPSKSDYIKHLSTHSKKQPYKCTTCGLSYKTKTNLNVHLKSHSLPAYECEFCKKKFYEKYRYKRHIWLHEEQLSNKSIDNFTCDICGRRFTSKRTLRKHQLVHVEENYKVEEEDSNTNYKFSDIIAYYCDNCSLEFEHKEAYETHMNLKHNIQI
ncbi:uncharacterized protein ACRADG_009856 isoform 1-T1 [Cochliomyia hominivorax]